MSSSWKLMDSYHPLWCTLMEQFISPIFISKTASKERERERDNWRERGMIETETAIQFICPHQVEYQLNDDYHLYQHRNWPTSDCSRCWWVVICHVTFGSLDTSSVMNSLFWVSHNILMDALAKESPPIRISPDTPKKKKFNNCNLNLHVVTWFNSHLTQDDYF